MRGASKSSFSLLSPRPFRPPQVRTLRQHADPVEACRRQSPSIVRIGIGPPAGHALELAADLAGVGASVDARVARRVPLNEAVHLPKAPVPTSRGISAGQNTLESLPNEALGDTDEAAVERCRRLLFGWAREAHIDRARWIMKADGESEADIAACAAHETGDLLRLMAPIRQKHRNEPEWDPGTPDQFAGGTRRRQVHGLSARYRARGTVTVTA